MAKNKTNSVLAPMLVFMLSVGALTTFGFFGQEIRCEIGHQYGDWQKQVEPLCEKNGRDRRQCKICDHAETRTVDNLGGHIYVSTVVQPTCTEQGYTRHACSQCGNYYDDSYVEATGHNEVVVEAIPPNCTDLGWTEGTCCSVCNEEIVAREKLAALGHDEIIHAEVPPTVFEDGLAEYVTCSRCDYVSGYEVLLTIGPLGLEYSIDKKSNTCVVTGISERVDWNVGIPAYYEGIPVVGIAANAFKECASLESVTIQEGITFIEDFAFVGCTNLKNVIIPNSVTSIGWDAFVDCTSLESITLPFVGQTKDSTESGHLCHIFSGDVPSSLKTVIITGEKGIGEYAFYGCSGLTSITIPDSVTSIGAWVFYGCSGLTSITIPDSVTSIGRYAFEDCSSLTSAIFENPQGWKYRGTSYDLSDPSKAANYLVSKYDYDWERTGDGIISNPANPVLLLNPKFINEQAQSKSIHDSNNIGSSEIITEGQRTFVRLTPPYGTFADPWVVIIPPGSNYTLPQYMAISYRTNSTSEGEFYVGSGEAPSGQGDLFMVNWVEGDWNFMVIDLTAVGLTSIIDNVINYARFDFLASACGEDNYFDVQYIGFFNTAEYAENYNEEMSKAPEQPTEPEVPTADPADPLHVVEPDFLANYAAQTGNLACVNDVASAEVKTEAGRTFIRLIAGSHDPYIAFIDGSKNLKVARYMAVSYRTNSAKDGQFFMGSGAGWNGQGDCFKQVWNEDGNWNLAIIDLDSVGLTALTDYILNYARCDFFDGVPNEGDYFDIEYIAFFNTAEYAAAYDIEMHKVPMWYADKSVVAYQSFDMLYLGTGSADNGPENIFDPGQSANWDFVADLSAGGVDVLTYWGWIGFKGDLGQFGYQIDTRPAIYNDEWTYPTEQPVIDAAVAGGADSGNRMKIAISLAGLEGEHTVRVLYKDAEGNVVCLNEFTVIFPSNVSSTFISNVASNEDGTDLQASDLSNYFTIAYGVGEPHNVTGGVYQYGGINELYTAVDGVYAFSVNMLEAANTAMAFVRGTRVVHSVDLPAVDGTLYPINNYYEADGQGRMGGAGIYAAIYNGKLNLMIKAYDDETRTHQINRDYAVKCEGTELTIADNGSTIYIMVDGNLLATVALSGSTSYEKICDLAEGITFAQTAVVTLADGTTDTIENTLVVATVQSQLGIAVRPATIKFDSIKVLGFNDVTIPDEFYLPAEKVNVALNKPVSADSTENDQNVPYKMTDGDESTR